MEEDFLGRSKILGINGQEYVSPPEVPRSHSETQEISNQHASFRNIQFIQACIVNHFKLA